MPGRDHISESCKYAPLTQRELSSGVPIERRMTHAIGLAVRAVPGTRAMRFSSTADPSRNDHEARSDCGRKSGDDRTAKTSRATNQARKCRVARTRGFRTSESLRITELSRSCMLPPNQPHGSMCFRADRVALPNSDPSFNSRSRCCDCCTSPEC